MHVHGLAKRLTLFALVGVIAVSMLLMSCSGGTTTTTTEPTQTAQPTQTTTPGPTQPTQAEPYGTLNVGQADFGLEQFDPNNIAASWGYALYDTLVSVDEKGNYVPWVAESWEISPDGNTWTFHIRDDVYFHDGTQLTAKDVKFSVDHFASANSTNAWSPYLTANYAGTEAPDKLTFVYHTETPEPTLIVPFSVTFMLPADYFTSLGVDAFNKHPIGSGPWIFQKHVPETSISFAANTKHWKNVPAFANMVIQQVTEEATRLAMFKRGELDIVSNISTDRIVEARDAGTKVVSLGLPTSWWVVWPGTWIGNHPTHDIRVRQAMSYAINRQEICDTYYRGTAVPGGRWFIAPGGFGWDDSWTADPYDPELAKQLLADAGYPDAFDTPTIDFYVTATQSDFAQLLQGYWTAVGIDVHLTLMESSAWFGIVFVRNEDPTAPQAGGMWMWGPWAVVPNAIYHSANMYTSAGVHTTGNDPHADELYKKATGELDPVLQRQYWTDFLNYAYDMWVNTGTVLIQPLSMLSDKIGEVGRGWIFIDDSYATMTHAE